MHETVLTAQNCHAENSIISSLLRKYDCVPLFFKMPDFII
jgi:hypothetical protein